MSLAVVTGANKGIGKQICIELAKKGFTVVLTARTPSKGVEAAAELQNEGLTVVFHQLDVTDQKSVDRLKTFLEEKYGVVDVLVNNAGIFKDYGTKTEEVTVDTMQQTFDTNTYGPFRVSKALLPLIKKSKDPRIINISSGAGQLGSTGYASYGMSKAALNKLTTNMAADYPRIKINCMCPGWVRTDMGGKNATRSVEKGAETAVWLATSKDVPSGKFFRDKKVIDW